MTLDNPDRPLNADLPAFSLAEVANHLGITPATLADWQQRFGHLLVGANEESPKGYANADVDTWLADSKTSEDPNVQYAEVEAQAAKDVPIMPIYFYAKVFMQSTDVKGWPFDDVEQNWYAKDLYKVAE